MQCAEPWLDSARPRKDSTVRQTRLPSRRMVGAVTAALLLIGGTAAQAIGAKPAAATYPSARISGPVTGGLHGRQYNPSLVRLAPWGYSEQEYFVYRLLSTLGTFDTSPLSATTRLCLSEN